MRFVPLSRPHAARPGSARKPWVETSGSGVVIPNSKRQVHWNKSTVAALEAVRGRLRGATGEGLGGAGAYRPFQKTDRYSTWPHRPRQGCGLCVRCRRSAAAGLAKADVGKASCRDQGLPCGDAWRKASKGCTTGVHCCGQGRQDSARRSNLVVGAMRTTAADLAEPGSNERGQCQDVNSYTGLSQRRDPGGRDAGQNAGLRSCRCSDGDRCRGGGHTKSDPYGAATFPPAEIRK